jgi:Domain of unknown function (DUF4440)
MKAVLLNLKRTSTHMNSSILAGCFLVTSAPWTLAQQVKVSAPAVSGTKAEQEIANLSEQKWRWMSDRNVDSLAELFDEQSVFVHMGGTMSKTQELGVIKSGTIQYRDIDIQDVSVRIIGDTAIVLSKIHLVAVVGGNEVTNPFMVTEVYVKEGGKRKLASLSFTRLLTPEAAR